jgi:xanthine dehydrogenase iron-sulfur cluster and FAD-binding subunit A
MSADFAAREPAINGNRGSDVRPHQSPLEAARDQAGLTGTKEAAARAECGACTVLRTVAPSHRAWCSPRRLTPRR